jgi:Zn-dependent protease
MDFNFYWSSFAPYGLWLLPLVFALTVHEFAHALAADRCGDGTPRANKRLTLDPLAHMDLLGFICMLFGPIGWAKPVPVNPFNFRNPRRDDIIVSAAGVATNLATAVVVAIVLRATIRLPVWDAYAGKIVWNLLLVLCQISVGLAVFNLIPLQPLDGSHVLSALLPYEAARAYDRFAPIAPFILLAVVMLPVTGRLLGWPIVHLVNLLLGEADFIRML